MFGLFHSHYPSFSPLRNPLPPSNPSDSCVLPTELNWGHFCKCKLRLSYWHAGNWSVAYIAPPLAPSNSEG